MHQAIMTLRSTQQQVLGSRFGPDEVGASMQAVLARRQAGMRKRGNMHLAAWLRVHSRKGRRVGLLKWLPPRRRSSDRSSAVAGAARSISARETSRPTCNHMLTGQANAIDSVE